MSLIKEYLYNIECDRCKDKLDPEFWHEEEETLESIMPDCGWIKQGNKHYCPDCYFIDDDDNIVIKD